MTPENYSPGFPHLCTKFPENFWKFIRNASSQRLLYSYGHPHAMHLENCTRTSSVHPFVWRAAIHLTVWQNHEHLCVGGTHVARWSAKAQWYFRKPRPGHSEGGEMKLL